MMESKQLQRLFGLTYWAIRRNVEGMSHEESLQGPEAGGNCANWVLGHVLQNRDRMLRLLDEAPVWTESESSRYARGSQPIQASESVVPLRRILHLLESSQQALLRGLDDEALLSKKTDKGTLGDDLFTFSFHESYHAGQLGILRRLSNRQGAIA
jgi:hypothetical protein